MKKIYRRYLVISTVAVVLAVVGILALKGCGGGGGGSVSPTPSQWVKVDYISTPASVAVLSGTAWVSQSYVGLHCAGIACIFDTTSTDSYPGVDVTFTNLTTGATGKATSYFGGATRWTYHQWDAKVPVTSGKNTIQISAYDPGGTGGVITVDVTGGILHVESTSPYKNAPNVPIDSTISATLNSRISPQTITSASFTVKGPSGNVTGGLKARDATFILPQADPIVGVALDGTYVQFSPDSNLLCTTPYTATITTALKDGQGYSLQADYTWNFTTGCTLGKSLHGVWGSSANDVFVMGDSGRILHYGGSSWSVMPTDAFNTLYGVWGNSGSDVIAVGFGGTILHYAGNGWTAMSSPLSASDYLHGIWGNSGSDVFAVGAYQYYDGLSYRYRAVILHYNGSAWAIMPLPPTGNASWNNWPPLHGIWGGSGSDVFAVGDSGTIVHYDGSIWATMQSGTTSNLYGVWGSSGSNVFAVGSGGTIQRLQLILGNYFVNTMSSGTAQNLNGVWGSSERDIFVVGDGGTIMHYDGSVWATMQSGTTSNLYGVWGSSGSNVFVVGASGTILHYDGTAWTILPP